MNSKQTDRYQQMFAALRQRGQKAFVPFLMLGDPTVQASDRLIEAVIAGGADALELGIGFSDPVADGPVVAQAHLRALAQPPVLSNAIAQIRKIRQRHPQLPIGVLCYANMALGADPQQFCGALAAAGLDSILVADCPLREKDHLIQACEASGLAPIFIAPPNIDQVGLVELASLTKGYIYLVSRPGVTGIDQPTLATNQAASSTGPSLAPTSGATPGPNLETRTGLDLAATQDLDRSQVERKLVVEETDTGNAAGQTGADLKVAAGESGIQITHNRADVTTIAQDLHSLGSVPVLQGFGIHSPQQIKQAIAGGLDGVICGSALLKTIEDYMQDDGFDLQGASQALENQVARLKAATVVNAG